MHIHKMPLEQWLQSYILKQRFLQRMIKTISGITEIALCAALAVILLMYGVVFFEGKEVPSIITMAALVSVLMISLGSIILLCRHIIKKIDRKLSDFQRLE